MRLIHKKTGVVLAEKVIPARTILEVTKGLLGRKDWPMNQALWIESCSSIHTFFMKFPIDVFFVDKKLKVVSVHKNVPPGRLIFAGFRAGFGAGFDGYFKNFVSSCKKNLKVRSVFEFKAGGLSKLRLSEGDEVYVGS